MQPHQPHRHQPHFSAGAASGASTPGGPTVVLPSTSSEYKRGKKRGSYNCGRCGLPKKGHSCHTTATTPTDSSADIPAPSSLSATRPPPSRQPCSHLRRALSFDDVDNCGGGGGGGGFYSPEPEEEDFDAPMDEPEPDPDCGGLPGSCLWEVLRRLPPAGLLSAAKVCKGWRETARRLWRAAEVLKLRVPVRAQVGFVGSVLHKCPALVSLSLRMERY